MGVREDFGAALDAVTGRSRAEHSASLPNKLAWACARALGVAGASLCVSTDPDLRIPLGASSEVAGIAEALQFTTGTGPCLDAYATGIPVWAPEAVLARRWPEYHRHLVRRTPFRAVHALPLRGELAGLGSLDLYFESDQALVSHDPEDARSVADEVAAALLADPTARGSGEPIWLSSAPARTRTAVAIAIGMVVIDRDLSPEAALELIRGHADCRASTADVVARQSVDRVLAPADLVPAPVAPAELEPRSPAASAEPVPLSSAAVSPRAGACPPARPAPSR
jgi:hypothetical protein